MPIAGIYSATSEDLHIAHTGGAGQSSIGVTPACSGVGAGSVTVLPEPIILRVGRISSETPAAPRFGDNIFKFSENYPKKYCSDCMLNGVVALKGSETRTKASSGFGGSGGPVGHDNLGLVLAATALVSSSRNVKLQAPAIPPTYGMGSGGNGVLDYGCLATTRSQKPTAS